MLHDIEPASAQVLNLLSTGRRNAVTGSEITIREVWCADDHQIGTGCDEHGRAIVFTLSLATGRGFARLM